MDSFHTVLNFARTMTWKNQSPVVQFVEKVYHTCVRLTQKAMSLLEKRLTRLHTLEKWFVSISTLVP